MATVCSSCSTDNADGALVCRQCGAALTPSAAWSRSLIPEDDTFDPLSAPTLVMQHTAPAALPDIEETQPMAPEGNTGRRLAWGIAGFIVLLGAGLWLLRPSGNAPVAAVTPTAAASAVALSAPLPAAASAPAGSASSSIAQAVTPAVPASAAEPTVTPAVAPATPQPIAPAASGVDRRKRIPEPVVRRPVPASAPVAPASEPAPAPPAAPPAAQPAEPVRPRSVAELCAGSNLLTRGFCEHRECTRAELAGDPVCVRLKEAEEARRFRQ